MRRAVAGAAAEQEAWDEMAERPYRMKHLHEPIVTMKDALDFCAWYGVEVWWKAFHPDLHATVEVIITLDACVGHGIAPKPQDALIAAAEDARRQQLAHDLAFMEARLGHG